MDGAVAHEVEGIGELEKDIEGDSDCAGTGLGAGSVKDGDANSVFIWCVTGLISIRDSALSSFSSSSQDDSNSISFYGLRYKVFDLNTL